MASVASGSHPGGKLAHQAIAAHPFKPKVEFDSRWRMGECRPLPAFCRHAAQWRHSEA
jgi:hypothetical protein